MGSGSSSWRRAKPGSAIDEPLIPLTCGMSYLLPHELLLPGFIRFSAMLCGRRRGSFGEFTDSGAPQFLHFGSFTQPPSVIQQGFRLLSDLFGRAVHREDMVRGRPGCHV